MNNSADLRQKIHNIILQAGEILLTEGENRLNVRTKSSDSDLVTEIDLMVEEFLKEKFSLLLPGSLFLAEETESDLKDAEVLWVIDPIDGTTNFVHHFPFAAISVALQIKGIAKLGFVYNPFLSEFFEAAEGNGSLLNGKRITVSSVRTIDKSLLATGFPYNSSDIVNFRFFEHFQKQSQGIRRPGSAALDLCYIAKGSFDGFWEWHLKPWDVAAGILIVEEAGGIVSDLCGENYSFSSDNILATNSSLHQKMLIEMKQLLA
jgi:myo-inositol-1(or 4)-monophosphatase